MSLLAKLPPLRPRDVTAPHNGARIKIECEVCAEMISNLEIEAHRQSHQIEPLPEKPVDKYAKHKSSTKENYCTPASFLELVTELGPIGLDPCSNANSLVLAKVEYRLDHGQDGLMLPWEGFGLVFVNPPYGKATPLWLRRMSELGSRGVEIVGLVAARPDTIEFQKSTAQLICFWRGRLVFLDGDTGEPCKDKDGKPTGAIFPQAVLYWGTRGDRFKEIFTYDATRPKGRRGGKVVDWRALDE